MESNESLEECVRREVPELAAAELSELDLIGGWKAKKVIKTDANAKYPDLAYQLIYFDKVRCIKEFRHNLEVLESAFVEMQDVPKFHHDYPYFEPVFLCTIEKYKLNGSNTFGILP